MPRLDTLLFQQESVKLEQGVLLHFIDISLPAVGTLPADTIRLVDGNNDTTFNGFLYMAYPFQFSGGFVQSSDGSVDKASLALANPERLLMPYINQYAGLKGTTITVYTVYESLINASVPSYITDYFDIDSYTTIDTVLTLSLDPSINFNTKLPRGQFNANTCRFAYKDPRTCKYSGPLSYCKKTLEDCKQHTVLFASGTVNKGTDINNNSVFWGSTFPENTKPGYLLVVGGATLTIQSVNLTTKLGDGTIITNCLIAAGSVILDGTNLPYQILKGNQRNFGGFPGVPTTVRRLVL